MKNKRITYFILLICIVALGILSRSYSQIPLFFGDILYAIMIYFGMRFLFILQKPIQIMFLALLFCYGIEFLQLYDAEWIVALRRTTLGHYALGQGFLWIDLVYYTLGVGVAYLTDVFLLKKTR